MGLVNQSLTYGAVNSADYGIYIGGEGVFNAPKRDTKLITIPGRNGVFAQDLGRFKNILVTYPCFYVAHDLTTFAEDLAAFREAMLAQIGYQRLEDTLNPNEYRKALFIDGLEVQPQKYNTVAKFELVFNCQPQRWLKSGTFRAVTSGATLPNPTRFSASPLFRVQGYGDITIEDENGGQQTITVNNAPLGAIVFVGGTSATFGRGETNPSLGVSSSRTADLNAGDTISLGAVQFVYDMTIGTLINDVTITNETGYSGVTISQAIQGNHAVLTSTFTGVTFAKGTAASVSKAFDIAVGYKNGMTTDSWNRSVTLTIAYDGAGAFTFTMTGNAYFVGIDVREQIAYEDIMAESTKTVGGYLYIDCDTGFCYYSATQPANNIVALPAELPTLPPGDNVITYANTFTDCYIAPRWWSV